MIERYTIKFGPAVSHKELEKKLHEGNDLDPDQLKKLSQIKVVIEAVCDAGDLKKIVATIKDLSVLGVS